MSSRLSGWFPVSFYSKERKAMRQFFNDPGEEGGDDTASVEQGNGGGDSGDTAGAGGR